MITEKERFAQKLYSRITDKDQFSLYRNQLFDVTIQDQMKKLSAEMKAQIKNPNEKQKMKISALQKQN